MAGSELLAGLESVDRFDAEQRAWVARSITLLNADANRSADTHLIKLELPREWGIDVYLKDESSHPTGSLKHRLARSLFTYALVNGKLAPGTPIIEATSGSTAVSEAYFARMLGLRFIAVMPRTTSQEKVRLIEHKGGTCHFIDEPGQLYPESERLAAELGGHFMDQFTYAERATDWRANNNIAESIITQLRREDHPIPEWLVTGAGTGGTSATLGRYLRYHQLATKLCVCDVERSAFFGAWTTRDDTFTHPQASLIEGIGRPRLEPSFIGTVVDRMVKIPDAASVAGVRVLSERLGRRVGGSSGTNFVTIARLVGELREEGRRGSIVSLLCDPGERYVHTYFNDEWVREQGLDIEPWMAALSEALPTRL